MGLKVRGYASVFGVTDLDGDVVARGAFSSWLKDNKQTSLPLFWNHAHMYNPGAKPVGHTTMLKQDSNGLYFEGLLNETAEGREVAEVLRGRRGEASFAFHVTEFEEIKGGLKYKSVRPFEITAANFGANPQAYIEIIPGQDATNGESNDEH